MPVLMTTVETTSPSIQVHSRWYTGLPGAPRPEDNLSWPGLSLHPAGAQHRLNPQQVPLFSSLYWAFPGKQNYVGGLPDRDTTPSMFPHRYEQSRAWGPYR